MIKSPTKRSTFGDWLTFWFEMYKKPVLKPYSVRNIEQVIRLHTPDWLKAKKLHELTIFDIDRALLEIPVSRTYVYTRQVWHAALFKACRAGLLECNPVDLCERVRYQKKKSKALTINEQRELIQRLDGSRYKWIILFYLHTGVRRTEALTIEWCDVRFKEDLLLIRGTKTEESCRFILLSDDVRKILAEQKKQNVAEKRDGDRVFPFCAENVTRAFAALCPGHHLHELRHTYITRCCESGINVNVCQQLVGHKSADMTVNVYTHVLDDFKRKEAAKFMLFPKE